MDNNGRLIISLDFELLWGVHDWATKDSFKERAYGARNVIPEILQLFNKYDIHATWATVGLLFCANKNEVYEVLPTVKPNYKNKKLSAYNYLEDLGKDEESDIFHYADSLVNMIKNSDGQEVGCHTFAHYYCKEDGYMADSFEADLISAKNIALKKGIELKSLVLPRNQFTKECVSVAKKQGFLSVRGNPKFFAYNNNNKWAKMFRLLDSYLNIFKKNYKKEELIGQDCVNVKASCFFRQYNPKLRVLESLKIHCIKKQMKHAAKTGKVFHLWWHPHNFGLNTKKNLMQLEELLKYYTLLREKYSFKSQSMGEFAEDILNEGIVKYSSI